MSVTTQQVLMHPPSDATFQGTTKVNGRAYSTTAGTPINAPDYDADRLEAAGWIRAATTGATAARPTNPTKGQKFADSTLGITIMWDGKVWRNAVTGAAV
jgi:hypothetical protein